MYYDVWLRFESVYTIVAQCNDTSGGEVTYTLLTVYYTVRPLMIIALSSLNM